jgi:HEAT repeat protein
VGTPELIRQCTGDEQPYARYMAGELLRFKREEVADVVRKALCETPASTTRAELIRLLGFFGAPSDVELITREVESADSVLANAADEAVLRVTDPLRLPDNWSGLRG